MSETIDIRPFRDTDVAGFLHEAAAEGWVAESWELEFLLDAFPQGCFTALDMTGEATGYVTALRHDRSGWIGNLIVADGHRGQGIGEALFLKAMSALKAAGVKTVWLTASTMGKKLYERHGFRSIDIIVRWTACGRQRHTGHDGEQQDGPIQAEEVALDQQAWGDRRNGLLAATAGRGRVNRSADGFLTMQPCGEAVQIGPFTAADDRTAGKLLQAALKEIPAGRKVYLDAPAANRQALRLYTRRRMVVAGVNELMYAGVRPDYRPELLYAMATMGSCG